MERILHRAAEIGKVHTGEPFVGTENVLRALVEDEGGIAGRVLRTPSTTVGPTPPTG
jgi:hypothetical protein